MATKISVVVKNGEIFCGGFMIITRMLRNALTITIIYNKIEDRILTQVTQADNFFFYIFLAEWLRFISYNLHSTHTVRREYYTISSCSKLTFEKSFKEIS